jgi:predicted dehydrogenase
MGSLHARVIASSEGAELVAVVDPAPVGAALAERYGVPWVPKLDDLSTVDAVVLAASTESHYFLAREILGAGKPLLVEKPVSGTLEETEELVAMAARDSIPLMCGYVERFNPAILTVTPMLSEPVHVSAIRHSPYAARIKTGVAWDLLIHDVDACLRLMGTATHRVRSGLGYFHPESEGGAEDVAEAVMNFDSGRMATASASRIGQRKIRQITISEINRAIEVDLLRRSVTIYRHVSNSAVTPDGLGYRQQTIIEIPELISVREPLAAQWDHFLGLLAGKVDLAAERDSILPAHRVIAEAMTTG